MPGNSYVDLLRAGALHRALTRLGMGQTSADILDALHDAYPQAAVSDLRTVIETAVQGRSAAAAFNAAGREASVDPSTLPILPTVPPGAVQWDMLIKGTDPGTGKPIRVYGTAQMQPQDTIGARVDDIIVQIIDIGPPQSDFDVQRIEELRLEMEALLNIQLPQQTPDEQALIDAAEAAAPPPVPSWDDFQQQVADEIDRQKEKYRNRLGGTMTWEAAVGAIFFGGNKQ